MVGSRPVLLNHRCSRVAAELCQLMAAAYEAEAQLIGATDFPPLQAALSGQLASNSTFVGIRCCNALVAAAEIEACSDGGSVIAAVVVAPDRFRQGLGETLLRYIVRNFSSRSIKISTACANAPARALYAKLGFEQISYWKTRDGISLVTLEHRPPSD